MEEHRIDLRPEPSQSELIVMDLLGTTWDVRLVTSYIRTDKFDDHTPAFRALALSQNRGQTDALVWWQPIDTRWW
jgi:hypothetical protein